MPIQLASSPILRFKLPDEELDKARENVSAIVLHGEHLWLGGDEGTSIDRMTLGSDGHFGAHKRFQLKDLLKLPAKPKEEIDIEGLDVNDGYLWLTGSHSAKRKKADKPTDAENLDRLATVELEGNRFTLARVPLTAAGEPAEADGSRTAARLEGTAFGNALVDALEQDDHLGRFIPRQVDKTTTRGIPSKDNGFDVEGLAVSGNRVYLGLRGPVLRGWAVILELRVSDAAGRLTLDPIGAKGEPYVKHFLELDGLGVREIVIHGTDLLILAGPSMDLDGPVFIYRWKNALATTTESLTRRDDLTQVVTVPFGENADHAEGVTIVTQMPLSVLVSYDSPSPTHRDGKDGVTGDIFAVS